jgi:hypothetical protein
MCLIASIVLFYNITMTFLKKKQDEFKKKKKKKKRERELRRN